MTRLGTLIAMLAVACGTTMEPPRRGGGGGGGGGGVISNQSRCEDAIFGFENFLAACFPDDFTTITEEQAAAECDNDESTLAPCVPVLEAWTECAEEAGCTDAFRETCWDQFRTVSICVTGEDPGENPPCPFTDDGVCDEPNLCAPGTDVNDCAGPGEVPTT
jgi:hypothetical protein